jgi:hypothetical protein
VAIKYSSRYILAKILLFSHPSGADYSVHRYIGHRNLRSYARRSMFEKNGEMFSADLHPIW